MEQLEFLLQTQKFSLEKIATQLTKQLPFSFDLIKYELLKEKEVFNKLLSSNEFT